MKSLRVRSVSFLFAILAFLSASPSATAGSYVYGISDDNKIHQVDLTSYIDTVVFDTGLAGLTNGVAWDSTSGKLYYRNPEDGSLYFWTQATNTLGYVIGEKLPGFNANASFYKGDYWYVEDGTDTFVRATFDFGIHNSPVVAHTEAIADFDGTAPTAFSFGVIDIDKSEILYGSSSYGLFSVNISGPQPTQFQILSSTFGVRQIELDPTQTFLYGQDHSTGNCHTATLNGLETPLNNSPRTRFSSTSLRDVSAVITTPAIPIPRETVIPSTVPEPSAWQLLLADAACLAVGRFRPKPVLVHTGEKRLR